MSFWSPLTKGVYHPGQSELLVQRVQSANETRLGFSTLSIGSHQSDPARSEPTRFFFMDGLTDQVGSLETLNANTLNLVLSADGWDSKKIHEKARQSRTCGAWRAWRSCRFVWLVLFVYFKFVFIVVVVCLFFFSVMIQFMSKSLLIRQARPYLFDRTLTKA